RPRSISRQQGRAVGLLPQDVKEEDVVTLNRLHGPTGCLLDPRTNLSCLLVAPLSISLALPECDSERLPGLPVAENHVPHETSLVANAWVDDLANNRGDIGDALGCCLQEIHSRKHFLTSHQRSPLTSPTQYPAPGTTTFLRRAAGR